MLLNRALIDTMAVEFSTGQCISGLLEDFPEQEKDTLMSHFATLVGQGKSEAEAVEELKLKYGQPSSIVFKCTEVSEEEWNVIAKGINILAIKGFASRLRPDEPIPPGLTELASSYDIFSFDGDDLRHDSFTKMIAALVHSRCIHSPTKRSFGGLHVLKYAGEVASFLESWDNVLVSFRRDVDKDQLIMSNVKLSVEDGECCAVHLSRRVTIFYRQLPEVTVPEEDGNVMYPYVELGTQHLELLSPLDVATIGGGSCVIDEFHVDAKVNRNRKWHLFGPLTRPKYNTSSPTDVEVCKFMDREYHDNDKLIRHV